MNHNDPRRIAAEMLDIGKRLVPDRFPQAEVQTIDAWAEVIISYQHWPSHVWREAVKLWAMEEVGQKMVTPREIVGCCRAVLRNWESDPVQGPALRKWRERLEDERDRAIFARLHAELEAGDSTRKALAQESGSAT